MRKLLLGLFPAVALAALIAGGSAPAKPAKERPNIVVLMSDDQTLESMRVMRLTQRFLGAGGSTFENNFVSFSLCCPSRASFLTGQYGHNHGVLNNKPPAGGYYKLDSSNTLPVWLRRAGYYTAHVGKYLNGYGTRNPREVPPGWSEWHGSVDPSTYRFYGYTLNENGRLRTYRKYSTDLYADKAVRIIKAHAGKARPLFLSVAFLAPHSGAPVEAGDPRTLATPVPPRRYRDEFASEPLPMPPSFNEANVSDKPQAIRRRPLMSEATIAAVRENYQQRLESVLGVDDAVGRIVAALRAVGQLDNTLIVYTSDNGFFHGEHRVPNSKVLLYEPSIRVPLLMRGPGVPAGHHESELSANIDLAPTIVAVAGASPGRALDGLSLFEVLASTRAAARDLLLEGPATEAGGPLMFTGIRTQRYKYVEWASGEKELYDLADDPDELRSRHDDPRYASIRADLAQRLETLRRCAASSCLYLK
jgi:N-acetylglucosamine-6-sulfatase